MGETREAGQELDAMVAEKVMGWLGVVSEFMDVDRTRWFVPSGVPSYDAPREKVPAYSTDLTAAWQVMEFLNKRGHRVGIAWQPPHWCAFVFSVGYNSLNSQADTAPLAICRVALLALDDSGSSLLVEETPNA
jgi:hypothetical protein